MLKRMLYENNLSIYRCSRLTSIPYTTLSEVVRGKTSLLKCSAEVVYKLSKLLNVSMEELIDENETERMDYETFKSNLTHTVKDEGDLNFIINILKDDSINYYWNKKWYFETFYTLGMLDYLSRLHDLPLCRKYDTIRQHKLETLIYPRDVMLTDSIDPSFKSKDKALEKAIPEFLQFNIVECEVRDVA